MYTVTQFAALVGCTRGYIKAQIRRGKLPANKIGNQYVIDANEAKAWLNNPRRGSHSKSKVKG